jgi:hypothetical protein
VIQLVGAILADTEADTWVFMYSLDRLLADEGTGYWQFCFGLHNDPADLEQKIGVYQSAYAHIMGRVAYERMAGALPTADHPFSVIMNAGARSSFPDFGGHARAAQGPNTHPEVAVKRRRSETDGRAASGPPLPILNRSSSPLIMANAS